jgi:glycosyltransferase involved in cell wall biosynthesis
MKIAFVTTQSSAGSTNIGRIFPIAEQLARVYDIHILVHQGSNASGTELTLHVIGRDPFRHTGQGKQRLSGIRLANRLITNTLHAAFTLSILRPDVVIISKSLPESVFAAWLYHQMARIARLINPGQAPRFILDVDDFELTANVLSSLNQRAAVHAAERIGTKLAHVIVTATPFLQDHFTALVQNQKEIVMIPTGIPVAIAAGPTITLPAPGSQPKKLAKQPPTLLYLGSVSRSSGHRVDLLPEIMIRLRQHFKQAKLIIAGDGDDTATLAQQFNARGLDGAVQWHGRFTLSNESEVGRLVNRAAIIIDPVDGSITNRAKSSFRTALAAATGTPVVTSDIGIRPYLIPLALHPRCFAAPADAEDYARKVIGLLEQPLTPPEREALVRHARQYRWDNLAQQFTKAILS